MGRHKDPGISMSPPTMLEEITMKSHKGLIKSGLDLLEYVVGLACPGAGAGLFTVK